MSEQDPQDGEQLVVGHDQVIETVNRMTAGTVPVIGGMTKNGHPICWVAPDDEQRIQELLEFNHRYAPHTSLTTSWGSVLAMDPERPAGVLRLNLTLRGGSEELQRSLTFPLPGAIMEIRNMLGAGYFLLVPGEPPSSGTVNGLQIGLGASDDGPKDAVERYRRLGFPPPWKTLR